MDRSKMFLIAGGLVSAAAAYYLSSNSGKKNLTSMIESGIHLKDSLQLQSNQLVSEFKSTAQEVIDTAAANLKAVEESAVANAKEILINEQVKYEYLHNGHDLSKKVSQGSWISQIEEYNKCLPN